MLSQQCSNILSLFSCRINDIGSEAHLDDDFSQINAQDYGSYYGSPTSTVEALKKSTKAKEATNDAKLKAKEDEAENKRVADVAE